MIVDKLLTGFESVQCPEVAVANLQLDKHYNEGNDATDITSSGLAGIVAYTVTAALALRAMA